MIKEEGEGSEERSSMAREERSSMARELRSSEVKEERSILVKEESPLTEDIVRQLRALRELSEPGRA